MFEDLQVYELEMAWDQIGSRNGDQEIKFVPFVLPTSILAVLAPNCICEVD